MTLCLPPRKHYLDKEDFQNTIKQLHDLGFDRYKCYLSLKTSFNNIDLAGEYLITNNIPKTKIVSWQKLRENLLKTLMKKKKIKHS